MDIDGIQKHGARAESCRPANVKFQISGALANPFSADKLFILPLRGAHLTFILTMMAMML
ncbi:MULTISPECIES: hypothetical protein [unclassified Bradyrhizobium]|uniref:hypothetical protein n=1 Tax=unclassified Bradyrhizobium TaxID=2631580 RepID=UPI00104F012B|nr:MULTISPECIES: hypothetical protein [unclassified Bradyrhizobium]